MRNAWKFIAGLVLWGALTASFGQAVWVSRNPLTTTKSLQAATYSASLNLVVAVGDNGTVVTSGDRGATWITRTQSVNKTLYGVAWGTDKFVAVGADGTILTSPTGTTWAQQPSGTTKAIYAVTWTGAQFVAVGLDGEVVVSTNGTSWAPEASGLTIGDELNSVTSNGASQVVAVGKAGKVAVRNGGTWGPVQYMGVPTVFYGVSFAGGVYVAAGAGGAIRSSTDGGVTWNQKAAGGSQLSAIAFGSQFVAVGANGTTLASTDAATWGAQASGTNAALRAVVWTNTNFVAVGVNGALLTSPNGTNWTVTSSSVNNLNAAASTPSLSMAVGEGGTILTSTDQVNWNRKTSGTTVALQAAVWSGTRWVVGGLGSTVLTSLDGETWTSNTSWGAAGAMYAVDGTTSPTTLVGVGPSDVVRRSTDGGQNWLTVTGVTGTNTYYGVTPAGPNTFLIMGQLSTTSTTMGGSMRASTNAGASWTTRTTGLASTVTLYSAAYASTGIATPTVVAVGSAGTIIYSTVAPWTAWNPASSGFPSTVFYSVKWTGSLFVAVGSGGVVVTSPNGITWDTRQSGTNSSLNGSTWNGTSLMAVGLGGAIITSDPAALPPAPNPLTPSDGAVDLPVNPLLTWAPSSGASSYRVQISTSVSFGTTIKDTASVAGTSLKVGPLVPGSTYYWRLNATGGTGTSVFSTPIAFTVIAAGQSAPALVFPANDTTNIPSSTTLSWNAYAATGVKYHLQVSTDSLFGTVLRPEDTALTGTSRILGGLASNTKYFWRVSATLGSGTTAWSVLRRFTTTPPAPGTPTLSAPANNFFGPSLTPTLSWNAAATASTYCVQLSTDNTFATTLVSDCSVTGTSKAVTGLVANTLYYWRVSASNGGGASAYSAAWSFATASGPPAKPTLGTPANAATGVDVNTNLTWNAATGSTSYRVQLSVDSNFATTFVLNDSLTVLTRNVGQLADNTIYYWRVIAKNPAGSTTSDRWSFRSGAAPTTPPPIPSLSNPVAATPAQFSTNVAPASINFSWNAAATAKSYRLQISTDNSFTTIVFDDSTIAGVSKVVTTLAGSTNYFWHVRAKNAVGVSGYQAAAYNFGTAAVIPAAPELTSPTIYSTGVSVSPTLTWTAVPGATSYRVQVSKSNTWTPLVVNDSVVTTSRSVGPLSDNTPYYWRVYARNTAGISEWVASLFTTGVAPLPETPELISPPLYATDIDTNTTYTWTASIGATSYQFQVSLDPNNFVTGLIANDTALLGTTRGAALLQRGKDYFWRVRARNSAGFSEYAVSKFSTKPPVAILPREISIRSQSLAASGLFRFALPGKERVSIRMLDTRGRTVSPDFEQIFEGGYHAISLPVQLRNTFYLIEFRAGNYRQVLKVHP